MSARISSKLVITFYILATFWICIKGICDVDVRDGSWMNFTFSHLFNDTSQDENCKNISRQSETSIFVLKIVSENPLDRAKFTLRWKDTLERQVNEVTTPEGIVKFINSSSVTVCCSDDICTSNLLVFYTELQRGYLSWCWTRLVSSTVFLLGSALGRRRVERIPRDVAANCFFKPGRSQTTFQDNDGIIKPSSYCQSGRYRPNEVSFWGIQARNGSVKLTVEDLDLDDYAGDYLLIGSSVTNYGNTSDVFQGPSPLFLTGKATKPKNIIVSTSYQSQVYIVLVAKTIKREDALGFTIRYQADGERIGPVSTKEPAPSVAESWKEAISLCVEVPKNDSNEVVNYTVTSFIVASVMELIRRGKPDLAITRSQIKVITLAWQRKEEDEYVTMLTIESWDHPNAPLLKADDLLHMFNRRPPYPLEGYKISPCDQIADEAEWLDSVAIAFVPIFLFVLLLIWWCQYKKSLSLMIKSNKKKPTLHVEMFPVIMTNPAFVPDSPSEDTELPQFFIDDKAKNKLDLNNKDSGFASCSTHPSSVKSTPGMTKRKVLFDIGPKEGEQEEKPKSMADQNNEESEIFRL